MLQMDVFNTFIELLRQTGNVTKGQTDFDESRQDIGHLFVIYSFIIVSLHGDKILLISSNILMVFFF